MSIKKVIFYLIQKTSVAWEASLFSVTINCIFMAIG